MASRTDAFVVSSVVREHAAALGMSRRFAAELALAASELATNCWRHGGGGRVELHTLSEGVELRVIDRGPGIADVAWARLDGVSRGRRHGPRAPLLDGLGSGLGSVHRLMDEVRVVSDATAGTMVVARKRLRGRAP